MSARVWIWLLSLSVLWGGSFFFAKVATGALGPLTVVFCRVALAALALAAVGAAAGRPLWRSTLPWPSFLVMGLLNNVVPFSLIFWAQLEIPSGLAAILNATTPLFTLLVAHAATDDETIDAGKLVALLVGLAGVAVLVGPAVLLGGAGLAGQVACLGAALSYALAGVWGRRFQALGVVPLEAAAGQLVASTVLILPIMLVAERPWTLPVPPLPVAGAVAGLALLSTALAYVLYFRILAAAGAMRLLLVTFLIPVTAILLGALVLGERLEVRQFAGMALIGLALVTLGRPAGARPRPAK
ncbi:DMT family transporter [Reyranella sp.]|uniref:DMT family transporter n=1 Tax=Reyranella sp. TaxID=1929291 RepID=UPI003BA8ECAB